MQRVLGIGGFFLRSADPEALSEWYGRALGLDLDEHGSFDAAAGPTVFATFPTDTDYLGAPEQRAMLNFRVRDLDAMLAQVREAGGTVAGEVQAFEGIGLFGWVNDPDGNRIELWQPA